MKTLRPDQVILLQQLLRYLLVVLLELGDDLSDLLQARQVRIELELVETALKQDVLLIFVHFNFLDSVSDHALLTLLLHLLMEVVERALGLHGSLTFDSSAANGAIRLHDLHLLSLLLLNHFLDALLLLSEVLLLELESVNRLHAEVERVVLLELVDLGLGDLLQLPVRLNTLLDELLNVNLLG